LGHRDAGTVTFWDILVKVPFPCALNRPNWQKRPEKYPLLEQKWPLFDHFSVILMKFCHFPVTERALNKEVTSKVTEK